MERRRNERAIPFLRSAVTAQRDDGNIAGEWVARSILCDALFSTGGFDEMDAAAEGWDTIAPDSAALGAIGAAFARAAGYAASGRAEEADALMRQLTGSPMAGVFRPLAAMVHAFTDSAAGRSEALLARFATSIAELELSDPMGRLAYAMAGTAMVHTERGEYDTALGWWERTEAEAPRSGLAYVLRIARFERALILGLQGRRAEAELELERAGPAVGTGWRDQAVKEARAVIADLAGDSGAAVAAAERALELAAPAPTTWRVGAAAELAPLLEANGAGAQARAAVEDVLAALDRQFPGKRGHLHRARLMAARAGLRDHSGEPEAAYEDLRRCFEEAGHSARHVLRSCWTWLEPIVWRALERGVLDPATVVSEVEAGLPGDAALVPLTRHPVPAARQAAMRAAAASGHPDAIAALEHLLGADDPALSATAASALERLRSEPPGLSFRLLGGFSVTRGSWKPDDAAWERRVAQRLVRFLLIHRDEYASEDEILEAFWSGRHADSARRSLRVAVSRARHVLDVPGATSTIEITDRMYRIRLRPCDSVDADQFEAAARTGLAEHDEARMRLLERAAALWGGEALPEERYSDWALGWRERLTDLHTAVLAALSDGCLERGDLIGAGLRARDLVTLDRLNEGAHQRLMIAYARAGQRNQALRQFLECRRALVEHLGVEPTSETARLQQRILAGDPV